LGAASFWGAARPLVVSGEAMVTQSQREELRRELRKAIEEKRAGDVLAQRTEGVEVRADADLNK
jgi:hypothetical protein